jgi:hypothetical protein
MTMDTGSYLAEVFGFPIGNRSNEVETMRRRYWCPFTDSRCTKQSRLLDYPFGVCSVRHHGSICAVCPRRFEQRGSLSGTPKVLEDLARHYFGSINNVVAFPEVGLPRIGTIDYVLVQHAPLHPEVTDFVAVEFQTDSTTGTGAIVQGLQDFVAGQDIESRTYRFGMNTYDTIKRFVTQLLNKGIVYEAWGVKCYWVIEEYIHANLVKRYGVRGDGFESEAASRFALYALEPADDRFDLTLRRFVSITVDEMYQAMRTNPGIPRKDQFVRGLNARLRARLGVRFARPAANDNVT